LSRSIVMPRSIANTQHAVRKRPERTPRCIDAADSIEQERIDVAQPLESSGLESFFSRNFVLARLEFCELHQHQRGARS